MLYFSGEAGWSLGNFIDGRKDRTVSTTGKPVDNLY